MEKSELLLEVSAFLFDYADCLDTGRYDDWPGYFDPDCCRYEIRSRENVELSLPAAIMYCDTHGMLIDRVTMLRKALTFRKMYLRHFISNIRVLSSNTRSCRVAANYQLMQTDNDGVTGLFSVGQYQDELVLANDGLKLREKIVVVDTFGIDNMLAVPI